MTARFNRFTTLLGTVGAVFEAAADINARRAPSAATLRALGIDEKAFRDIRFR